MPNNDKPNVSGVPEEPSGECLRRKSERELKNRGALSQSGDTAQLRPVENRGNDGTGDEGMGVEANQEEGERVHVRRAPKGPTKREREEHEATHIPYRS